MKHPLAKSSYRPSIMIHKYNTTIIVNAYNKVISLNRGHKYRHNRK